MKVNINGYIVANDEKEIYDWYKIDAFCPNDMAKAIRAANGGKLDIEIGTCYGGSIFAGSEIGAAIKGHKGGAHIDITAFAASAASVIAMFAHCSMAPTAMMMVHNVSSMASGDYREMDKESEVLKQCNKSIAAAYCMKTGISEKEALRMMDAETWLTAQDAKQRGLVDSIMFVSSQLVASAAPGMLPKAVIEKARQLMALEKFEKEDKKTPKDLIIARAKLDLVEKTI